MRKNTGGGCAGVGGGSDEFAREQRTKQQQTEFVPLHTTPPLRVERNLCAGFFLTSFYSSTLFPLFILSLICSSSSRCVSKEKNSEHVLTNRCYNALHIGHL